MHNLAIWHLSSMSSSPTLRSSSVFCWSVYRFQSRLLLNRRVMPAGTLMSSALLSPPAYIQQHRRHVA